MGFVVYSYSQTNPNLVLTSNQVYWYFQEVMWQLGYHNRPLSTLMFLLLILTLFGLYGLILKKVALGQVKLKHIILLALAIIIVLLPSYPALSNDIYNYLMNGKIIHVYQSDPHINAPWDFPDEPWLTFMMNVHTTSPYGPVWTGIEGIIFFLVRGDLQLGMLGFRLLGVLSMAVVGFSIYTMTRKVSLLPTAMFILNPLIMIEAVNNAHNDITMMALFMMGLAWWHKNHDFNPVKSALVLVGFWILSVYTKLVTVIVPFGISLYAILGRLLKKINLADLLTWMFFAAMFADGAKRFFSWYLIWGLSVFSLAKSSYTKLLGGLFSLTGLLSYAVFLYKGEYTLANGYYRIGVLFSLPMLYTLFFIGSTVLKQMARSK